MNDILNENEWLIKFFLCVARFYKKFVFLIKTENAHPSFKNHSFFYHAVSYKRKGKKITWVNVKCWADYVLFNLIYFLSS